MVDTIHGPELNEDDVVLVIFRTWKEDGEVFALFPELPATYLGGCMSYQHIGQHCAADYNSCLRMTKPAKLSEYKGLKKELENIGYKLKVAKRRRTTTLPWHEREDRR